MSAGTSSGTPDLPIPFDACDPSGTFVFVSYAHDDKALVYPELLRIRSFGIRVWYDEGIEPGTEWPEAIGTALYAAAAFVVMITPSAVTSRNVRSEIDLALKWGKPVFAVHLAQTALPKGLELQIGSVQAIMRWRMDEDSYARKLGKALASYAEAGNETRLFPDLPGASFAKADLGLLARAMTSPPEEPVPETEQDPEENPGIPAAYTYLGQFVDRDLTFDLYSRLRESLTKAQLQQLGDYPTPRFDLDILYGRGPDDQPDMYRADGIHMLLGVPLLGDPFDPGASELPRGPNGRALIGDPRNDENRIVAQLHAIFLRFHNRVADYLGGNRNVSFQDVRQQVRWHYQWVLVNDFLPRILDERTYQSVFPDPYTCVTTIPRLRGNDLGLMPVEFLGAAYRFGHSMIRPRYRLNRKIERPIFSSARGDTADLGGFRPIPSNWAIDWRFFIDLDPGDEPQLSYKIDTSLAHPLGHLPTRIAIDPSSLALRNLERGLTFQLPSGQRVAEALGLQPIADEDLVIGKAVVGSPRMPITEIAPGFAGNAPLWAYILSEAQVMSWKNAAAGADKNQIPVRLGPVGGRLVAEVFASLLRGDPTSYLHADPAFEPFTAFTRGGRFGLAELINVTLARPP
jgi:hypothetical protein